VSSSGFSNPEQPAAEDTEFTVEAQPDKQVEDMTQESIRDITYPMTNTKVLEYEPPCQNGCSDVSDKRNSVSKQSQKYGAEVICDLTRSS